MATKLVGRITDQSVMHYWSQRSWKVQLGSSRGQFAKQCPMATKFGGKNPWPERNALLRSKVIHGSAKVNQRSNSLEMPCGHQILVEMTPDQSVMHWLWGCVCVCIDYVCPAMHFAMLRRIEPKLGMGVGDGPTRFVGIFSKGSHLGSKVIQGSICLRNALWLPNLVRRTPDPQNSKYKLEAYRLY